MTRDVAEEPTTSPRSLIARAELNGPPRVPRSVIVPRSRTRPAAHRTARVLVESDEYPATWPASLTSFAPLDTSPANGRKSRIRNETAGTEAAWAVPAATAATHAVTTPSTTILSRLESPR